MGWIKNIIDKASMYDFVNRATIRREEQLKTEENFDQTESNIIADRCGERTLIEIFKTRSELNRELTREVNDHSLLSRGDAYDNYLDCFDRFYRDVEADIEKVKADCPDACMDLERTLEDFKLISNNVRNGRN
jgi:hypothetical protein